MGLKNQEDELVAESVKLKKEAKPTKPAITKSKKWDAKPSHKLLHTVVTIFVTLLIIGGVGFGYYYFTQETATTVTNNPGPVLRRTVEGLNPSTAKFDEAAFTFALPNDWKRLEPILTGPYQTYTYQSAKKNAENRKLYVYVDGIPLDRPLNKVVRVDAAGDSLNHGEISAQCTDFTPKTGALKVPAKWDGVDFLCDMDSWSRNVVGTSAPGSINKVTLTNLSSASRHDFFIIYEDNNYNPDYSIFYEMLGSFKVK